MYNYVGITSCNVEKKTWMLQCLFTQLTVMIAHINILQVLDILLLPYTVYSYRQYSISQLKIKSCCDYCYWFEQKMTV